MANVEVVSKHFEKDNGELIPYKQLRISGTINGEYVEVTYKGDKNTIMLTELLLNSKEDLKVVHTTPTDDEPFKDKNDEPDGIDLFDGK